MTTVGAVLINYNCERLIISNSKSLFVQQTIPDLLVIVSNSPLNSRHIYDSLEGSPFPIHIIINKSNLGFGRACNLAFKYLINNGINCTWLINPDVVVNSCSLHELMLDYSRDSNVAFCSSLMVDPSSCQIYSGSSYRGLFVQSFPVFDISSPRQYVVWGCAASALINLSAVKQVGGFSPYFFMYGEDLELCQRFKNAGFKVITSFNSTVTHIPGSSSKSVHIVRRYRWHYDALFNNLCYFPSPRLARYQLFLKYFILSCQMLSPALFIHTFKHFFLLSPSKSDHYSSAINEISL